MFFIVLFTDFLEEYIVNLLYKYRDNISLSFLIFTVLLSFIKSKQKLFFLYTLLPSVVCFGIFYYTLCRERNIWYHEIIIIRYIMPALYSSLLPWIFIGYCIKKLYPIRSRLFLFTLPLLVNSIYVMLASIFFSFDEDLNKGFSVHNLSNALTKTLDFLPYFETPIFLPFTGIPLYILSLLYIKLLLKYLKNEETKKIIS
mgnify:CR=1 FL=1